MKDMTKEERQQIFGSKKDFDTKNADRYFKECGIKAQFNDMKDIGMSKGKFNSVCQAVGGYQNCKDKDLVQKRIWRMSNGTFLFCSPRSDRVEC